MKHSKLILLILFATFSQAQQRISLEELIQIATENNFQNSVNDLQIRKSELERDGSVEIPKTGIFVENEDFRPSDANGSWKIGISQEIPWPGLNKARKNYMEQLLISHEMNRQAIQAIIKRDVKKSYYELWYLQDKKKLYLQLDGIYRNMFDAATIRYNVGDVAGLDKISAEVKYREIQAFLLQIEKEIQVVQQQLMLLSNHQVYYLPEEKNLTKISESETLEGNNHPSLLVQQQNIEISESMIEVQKNANKPDFSARVFSQSYLGIDDPITGFSVSVAFPLFGMKAMKTKIKSLEANVELQKAELNWQKLKLDNQKTQASSKLEKEQIMLDFYEVSGLKQAESIISASTLSYKSGEISFAELSQFLAQAISIKQNYLDALNIYNQSMIEYQYLVNQN
jgi:cobalt-zinc-cadmium resistance protein CzcA